MALALGEDRHQHIGASHLLASGGLDVDVSALDDALEACGRLRIVMLLRHEVLEFVLDIVDDLLLQHVDVDRAGLEDRIGVGVVRQRQEQVLQRRIFVVPVVGQGQGTVERLFK